MFSTQSILHKRFNIPLQSSLKKAFSYFPLSMFSVAAFPLKHSLQGIDPSAAKWLMCRRDKLFLQSILLVRWTWAWTPQRSLTQHWTILLEEERNSLAGHRGHQQSLISITTLSWSGNVLRHMVNYSSIDMHVLLCLVLVPESVHHPSSLPKHLFAAGVQSYVINSMIW